MVYGNYNNTVKCKIWPWQRRDKKGSTEEMMPGLGGGRWLTAWGREAGKEIPSKEEEFRKALRCEQSWCSGITGYQEHKQRKRNQVGKSLICILLKDINQKHGMAW